MSAPSRQTSRARRWLRRTAIAAGITAAVVQLLTSSVDPGGARVETEHLVVCTDSNDVAFVTSVAALAERDWAALERVWKPLKARTKLNVYRNDDLFQKHLGRVGESSSGVAGLYTERRGEPIVLVSWTDSGGASTLAHELVHRFVAAFLGDVPKWLNEGLASELSHTSELGSFLEDVTDVFRSMIDITRKLAKPGDAAAAAKLAEAEARLHKLEAVAAADAARFPWVRLECGVRPILKLAPEKIEPAVADLREFRYTPAHYALAAAVVRWAIETRKPANLTQLAGLKLDGKAFAAWLATVREGEPEGWHQLYPPIGEAKASR